MYLEVFTSCVGYSDFLDVCLYSNKKHFDRWVIITSTEDVATKSVCKKHQIECVESSRFYEGGAAFNKGKGLNDAISYLDKKDWMLALDADIILPDNFREIIEGLTLDKEFLYGAVRYEIDNISGKQMYIDGDNMRILGFFQLFHATRLKYYPEDWDTAGWYDDVFADYWDSKKTLQKLVIQHIEHGVRTTNWEGRKSKPLSKTEIGSLKKLIIKL
ncbi:MAG: hypothetical protein M0R80_01750 [Proteobacteria bacterium]|jgi:hypothetical protein|nr:hypothetical protein [Pseudomonadota bacterium]